CVWLGIGSSGGAITCSGNAGSRTVGRITSSRERGVHLLGISSFRTAREAGSACIESARLWTTQRQIIRIIRTGRAVYFALYWGETLPESRKPAVLSQESNEGFIHNKLFTHSVGVERKMARMTPFKRQEAVCRDNIQEAQCELKGQEGTVLYESVYRKKVRPWKVNLHNLYFDRNEHLPRSV